MRLSRHIRWVCSALLLLSQTLYAQKEQLYLFPGQGSDFRIFEALKFDTARYEVLAISYPRPDRKDKLSTYAFELIPQLDTSQPFSFIGVSLGGMIAQELCSSVQPKKVIAISSITQRKELPPFYRSQRWLPIYRLFPAGIIKLGSRIAQPLFEPDRKTFAPLFKSMLKAKDARFLKRAIGMIAGWQPPEHNVPVIHIHGDKDSTLPIRRTHADHIVQGGSHMMVRTCSNLIQPILDGYLSE